MSMFSIPDEMLPTEKMLDDKTKDTKAMMPRAFVGEVNLMVHPLARAAAISALGMGLSSHAIGMWFGVFAGTVAASQRMLLPMFGDADADAFRDALRTPAMRAEAIASALIADAADEAPATKVRKLVPKARSEMPAQALEVLPAEAPPADSMVEAQTATEATRLAAPQPAVAEIAPADALARVAETPAIAPAVADAPLLPEDFRQPAGIDRPERPDDLKAIAGIGPKLEQVLNGLGIWTFGQIAGWGRAEVAWVDDRLGFRGRIDRDTWIAQARKHTSAPQDT